MKWPFATDPRAVLEVIADRGFHLFALLVFALGARLVVGRAVRASFGRIASGTDDAARSARLNTLGGLLSSAIGYAIFFVALLMVLGEFGLDTKAVLTTAGVFGVAVGLGSQKLVRDVIGGFFILLENQFSVGETVTLGGPAVSGVVEEMGLRVTRLRDASGALVLVGNADITCVTNHSRGPGVVNVDVLLPEDADLKRFEEQAAKAIAGLPPENWTSSPRVLGLMDAPEAKVKVRVSGEAAIGRRTEAEIDLRAALHGARE
jgi:small conductance mechanosensitive channel